MTAAAEDESIAVTVRLSHGLRHLVPGEPERQVRIPAGTSIAQLVGLLGIPQGQVSIVSRQGVLASKDEALRDGDVVEFYPPIGGGA